MSCIIEEFHCQLFNRYSYFRRKVWALALTAGNDGDGFEFNSTYSVFAITVTLTKEGYHNMDKVLAAVFGYLKMMKNNPPNERIYNEIQKIEELDFRSHPICEFLFFLIPF